MDVSAFGDENFDPAEWINKMYNSAPADSNENKEEFLMALLKKLQVYTHQVSNALEESSQKVLQNFPRVVRDTELLNQEALLLKDKMHSVKEELAKAEQDTGHSMAALEKINRLKTDLQAAKQALHEADNWTILVTQFEESFEKSNLDAMAAKLVSMQQSLRILANAPDVEAKQLQLEGLKNRLEAKASPALVQAFTAGSFDEAKRLVNVFESIERLPQLLKYHHKCQEKNLYQKLKDLAEMEQDELADECLRRIYDAILVAWNDQAKWCSNIFPDTPSLNILLPLFADLLVALEPSISSCVGSALSHEDCLGSLLDLRLVTKNFGNKLNESVHNLIQDRSPDPDMILALAQATNAPWVIAVQRYGELEKPRLLSTLSQPEALADRVQIFNQTKVLDLLSPAVTRCMKLTEGCGAAGLLEAIEVFVEKYISLQSQVLQDLLKEKSDREDWTLFQMCLNMLQSSGELMVQLEELDNLLSHNLRQFLKHVSASTTSPFEQHDELLLTPDGRSNFHLLMTMASQGDPLMEPSLRKGTNLCSEAHKTAVEVIFSPVTTHFEAVLAAKTWKLSGVSADLPDFSFSPQEYITQIGQYLMILPQHLEPFLDSQSLKIGLIKAGLDIQGSAAELLLNSVAKTISQAYCEKILTLEEIGPAATKQLATDINYLGNVLEDLGMSLSEPLQQVCLLLKLPPQDYQTGSSGCSPRLVAAIRQVRTLTSSN
ncbi:conserved oligomeric Golgi complex subunit 7 [Neocloeon triangulifer]|uniref:conserved oligomeric Golgi complex subunit 7 n=1 Tax=Neocloeon triangulifer TaxID=2078957 RepID=UPI00286EF0C6|nr:conserved oligomeric Golgi complex subunit 7 [Neocloeon triangulifer]